MKGTSISGCKKTIKCSGRILSWRLSCAHWIRVFMILAIVLMLYTQDAHAVRFWGIHTLRIC